MRQEKDSTPPSGNLAFAAGALAVHGARGLPQVSRTGWPGNAQTGTIPQVTAHDRLAEAGAGALAVERAKQLAAEHHARSFEPWSAILSFRLLRQSWPRLWTPPLVTPPVSVPRPAPGAVALSFVGHATMMLTTSDVRAVVDPFFENWLGLLRRARAATIDPADLADVGLVLISGARPDRLSPRSLDRIPRSATVVVPTGCGSRVAALNFSRVVSLAVGNSFTLGDIEIHAVPTHPWQRQPGACGYVVRTQDRVIYLAGETGYFPGFSTIGTRYAPHIAVLPIGGYQPASFRRRRLSPLDAIYAFEDLRASELIPVAFGDFALGYEPLAEPEEWLRELVRERHLESVVTILGHGQTRLLR